MIRDVNKEKRMKWATDFQDMTYRDAIYTDETRH